MTTTMETEIRPFTVRFRDSELDELRRSVGATGWPTKELVDDRSQVRNAFRSLR